MGWSPQRRGMSSNNGADDRMVELVFPDGSRISARPGEPEMEVLERAGFTACNKGIGYKVKYGCKEGRCGTCEHKVTLLPENVSWFNRPCLGTVPQGTLLGDNTTMIYEAGAK